MKKTVLVLLCVAASSLPCSASAQVGRTFKEGPVTAVTYLKIDYGRFDDYVEWLTATWKPTMEAKKKAGLILDYKVFSARSKSPGEPNVLFMITYPNMAGLDRGAEEEAVSEKVIGSAEVQNKARVGRSEYRTVLGSELLREIILR
jgi:hypothetical protein